MSFTEICIGEAVTIQRKNQCCRRSFALGILLGGAKLTVPSEITLRVKTQQLCELMLKLIKEQFGREAQSREAGKKAVEYVLSFSSAGAASLLNDPVHGYESCIKCSLCRSAFLCGLLCTCTSINDPRRDYYLSIRIDLGYKEIAERALREAGIEPCYRVMGKKGVFYLRASAAIEDFLAVCGMQRVLFDFINQKIENEYRNNTNRAINIEVNNIKKSIASAKKYITAIEWLTDNDRLTGLDSELYEAARLRVQHPECSLSALGTMMTPTVSKSGVLHRLNRIYSIYEQSQKQK